MLSFLLLFSYIWNKEIIQIVSWVRVLEDREAEESQLIFKHHLLQDQNQYIPMSKKMTKGRKISAWMIKKLLEKSQREEESPQGGVTEYLLWFSIYF